MRAESEQQGYYDKSKRTNAHTHMSLHSSIIKTPYKFFINLFSFL